MSKNSFVDTFQEKLGTIASKISSNLYVLSIRDAMLAYMPFTFIASIFLIIAFPPVQAISDFISNITGMEEALWKAKLLYVNAVTLNISGLLVVVACANSLAGRLKINNIQVILTAVVSFLLLTPQGTTEAGSVIEVVSIGSKSIFLAMIVSMLSAKIYQIIARKGITIKMPDTVPPAVSAPFEAIIPSFIIVALFWVIRIFLASAFNSNALDVITLILGAPLKYVGGSIIGVSLTKIFEQILWFFGIHGGSIRDAVLSPILQVLEDENKTAVLAGLLPPNIVSSSFMTHFAGIGVIGSVLAIIISAKSKRYKEMGKIAGVPYVFNIGEPSLFGIPLMLNPTYFIPFVFNNAICAIIAYIVFAIGLVPIPTGLVQLPWTTPLGLSGYLVTGSISGAILQIVLLVVTTVIWIPFIKIEDKKILAEERGVDDEDKEDNN